METRNREHRRGNGLRRTRQDYVIGEQQEVKGLLIQTEQAKESVTRNLLSHQVNVSEIQPCLADFDNPNSAAKGITHDSGYDWPVFENACPHDQSHNRHPRLSNLALSTLASGLLESAGCSRMSLKICADYHSCDQSGSRGRSRIVSDYCQRLCRGRKHG